MRSSPVRFFVALLLCAAGAAFATLAFRGELPRRGPRISLNRPLTLRTPAAPAPLAGRAEAGRAVGAPSPNAPTFGHPIISGIGGSGFEQGLRLDPSDPNRVYTSAPGTAAADTSWIWRSLDAGRTFKWVPNALPLEGKVTACNGGGDTELGVDSAGHLYFNDLTLANFSTARSDDGGVTFTCSNTGVPDTAVDRQWYTIDGDPTNGGNIYLANDEIGPGAPVCGSSMGNNVLVMYRSPIGGLGATAGIEFGPANHVSAVNSCDEAIMGNNELSPVATTLGQPDGNGGYATLATAVKHIYVIHDNAFLNKILIGRCFPVAFGPPIANVSDPSGLNCVDLPVADLGPNAKTGGDFPTMAIDRAGNLYAVWEQAPINAGGMINGDTVLMYSYSTNQGNTWSAPLQINTSGSPVGTLRNNVFAWMAAGDDGRIDIVWYGTPGAPTYPSNGPDSCPATCDWSLWMVQSLNAHDPSPTFTAPILASEHFIHRGSIQTLMGGQTGDRTLGDFLQVRMGSLGEANISYADSNNIVSTVTPHGMFVRQNGGTGLLAGVSPLAIPGLAPMNSASDQAGDGKYEAGGTSSANMPQLDILQSSITKVTTAPCSVLSPCYRIAMKINNLSLAPTLAQDPDTVLVWNTQWFVPSSIDAHGGKNFHVYAESNNGAALQCFYGENAITLNGGGATLTYPGNGALPAANCQSTLGPNGSIVIYVPLANVNEPGAIDAKLHEVTASTMTLVQPANTVPSVSGIGGSYFNLIDVVQSYVFDPAQVTVLGAVSRKTHGGTTNFDIDLPQNGPTGVECRRDNPEGNAQVIVTFANPVSAIASATASVGSVASVTPAGNTATINLTGLPNAKRVTLTLNGVNDGTVTGPASVTFDLLLGDSNGDGTVNSGDAIEVRNRSGQLAAPGNFRSDLNIDGTVNSGDSIIARAQSGTTVAP